MRVKFNKKEFLYLKMIETQGEKKFFGKNEFFITQLELGAKLEANGEFLNAKTAEDQKIITSKEAVNYFSCNEKGIIVKTENEIFHFKVLQK